MQLVAYGAQDIYLTGNPQITFFKMIYKRHTNFAVEAIEQILTGNPDFGGTSTCEISKDGDLLTKMYLKFNVTGSSKISGTETGKWAFINKLGHNIINKITINIGGNPIDTQYGEWMNIWWELTRSCSQDRGYNKMIGNTTEMTELSTSDKSATLFIPLQFWFCRNNGLALPLIALQYHKIRISLMLKSLTECVIKEDKYNNSGVASTFSVSGSITNASILVNYVYLDSDESKRFAQSTHEYLIEQIQHSGEEKAITSESSYNINFNHPCKSLYWILKNNDYNSGKKFLSSGDLTLATKRAVLAYTDFSSAYTAGENFIPLTNVGNTLSDCIKEAYTTANIISENSIDINNIEVPVLLDAEYVSDYNFSTNSKIGNSITRNSNIYNPGSVHYDVVLYKWNNYALNIDGSENPVLFGQLKLNGHERFSKQTGKYFNFVQSYESKSNSPNYGINMYSFALNPIEHQPSGTCNFSRIDNSVFDLEFNSRVTNSKISFYTINYNVLRIMSGLGGLAYSN